MPRPLISESRLGYFLALPFNWAPTPVQSRIKKNRTGMRFISAIRVEGVPGQADPPVIHNSIKINLIINRLDKSFLKS